MIEVDARPVLQRERWRFSSPSSIGDGIGTICAMTVGEAKIFNRKDIEEATSLGRYLIIFESKVYDVTSWRHKHPGGELLLRHMIGRDATDQIRVNHSDQVIKKMSCFYIGDMDPTDSKINRPLSLAFRKLHDQLKAEGYYKSDYGFFALQYARFFAFFAISLASLFLYGHTFWGCTVAGVFMGAFWQQMAFVGHDTGHNGITHNRRLDNFVGIVLGNTLSGISVGWWKGSHNVHHLVTNDPEHDPDIQHLPFFAVTTRFFDSLYSTFHGRRLHFDAFCQTLIPLQHILYFPIMMFARLNLFLQSFIYLAKHKTFLRWLEVVGLLVFWCWFPVVIAKTIPDSNNRVYFFFLSLVSSFVLHLQINLSHFAMATEPMGDDEEFVRYQLRTTLDVDCPTWMDWFHGGLQFQVVHHLFPRIPRHNLRTVRDRVVEFCNQHNLTYHCKTFTDGNLFVLGHLKSIADQVQILAEVAASEKHML